jgi:hypothetical protein
MEVGQGPNWGCSAKEKKLFYQSGFSVFEECQYNCFLQEYVFSPMLNPHFGRMNFMRSVAGCIKKDQI